MRPQHSSLKPARAGYHVTHDSEGFREEGDSLSSSSNSPARENFEESDFYAGNNDSQSSIGVPTFQDMAVSEEICEPPANRLPAEVLIGIFSKLSSPSDLLNAMLVSKRWARNGVDLLWLRPTCTDWAKHSSICATLELERPYFDYKEFIKRLNLASIAANVSDGSVQSLKTCKRIERLTLTGCVGLSDAGLRDLLEDCNHLLALDISGDTQITSSSMYKLAENCSRLQGLNISGCTQVSSKSMIAVAEGCKYIKRLKLNDCFQIDNAAVMAFAQNCPNILEIDLHQCKFINDEPITELFRCGNTLRELRLAFCELITDSAFTSLPTNRTFDHLRILDLTSCALLTDAAVDKIITVAPRIRNLVFAKCRNLTDAAVNSISRLGKNLHYLHLGHCGQIRDPAVIKLVALCNRIRYIDLGCCVHLTDESITKLANLPKLRRIGLVKCANITDRSVMALAQANNLPSHHPSHIPGVQVWRGGVLQHPSSNLERVHLSYCTNLTLESIVMLLNRCQKLTHLSLTGVRAFLRPDLSAFCREAPAEFTENQRLVFCVFSGTGVQSLRNHLNGASFDRNPTEDDDDQTMITGPVTPADDDDGNGDEELEDADADPDADPAAGVSFGGGP